MRQQTLRSNDCRSAAAARLTAAALTAAILAAAPAIAAAQTARWVGAWATGPLAMDPPAAADQTAAAAAPGPRTPVRVRNQTIRQFVRTSIGGSQVRVALTNLFGDAPLEVGAAHVARRATDTGRTDDSDADTGRTDAGGADPGGAPGARTDDTGTDGARTAAPGDGAAIADGAPLTFRGRRSVVIEAGSTVLSDPAPVAAAPLGDLAIDLYLPGDTWGASSPGTVHTTGLSTAWLSAPGDHTGAARFDAVRTTTQWLHLARVEVLTATASGAVVAMGDSITDGTGSTVDANRRWPDVLAARLRAAYGDAAPGVLNVGIAGNRVLADNAGLEILRRAGLPIPPGGPGSPDAGAPPNPNALFGPSGLSRFDRDVLLQPGATHVIVLETTNDIGMAFDDPHPTADALIAGHRALIQRARARGLRVYGGTLLPFEGAFYWTEAGEAKRQALNAWIRTSGAYDAVIDFAAAVRDPDRPTRFRPDLHADDWLHPNDAGYAAMADAIDLTLFAPVRAAAPPGRD